MGLATDIRVISRTTLADDTLARRINREREGVAPRLLSADAVYADSGVARIPDARSRWTGLASSPSDDPRAAKMTAIPRDAYATRLVGGKAWTPRRPHDAVYYITRLPPVIPLPVVRIAWIRRDFGNE